MKKLILISIINTLLIVNIQSVNSRKSPHNNDPEHMLPENDPKEKQQPMQIQSNPAVLSTVIAKFAALKNYLTQQTTPSTQKDIVKSQIIKKTPFIEYNPEYKRITLNNKNFNDINSYILSPSKKYLIINASSPGAMLRLTEQKQFFGYNQITKLIDTASGNIIKEFDGNVITFEFSPNEETLLIAIARNPTGTLGTIRNIRQKPSEYHENPKKQRKQTESGEILFYELFDIPSALTTMKFENVQATSFAADNKLLIKYDDNSTEQINLSSKQQSIQNKFKQVLNYLTRGYLLDETDYSAKYEMSSLSTADKFIGANYHYYDKNLTITLPNNKTMSFEQVNSYYYSPKREYLIINKKPESLIETAKNITAMIGATQPSYDTETIIYSTQSGKTILSLKNVVTYEFSPDETKIITLDALTKKPTYQLYNLITSDFIKKFTHLVSIYFTSDNELIGINKSNQKISFNASTGETNEEKQQREKKESDEKAKQELIRQEKEKKEKERLKQEKKDKEEQEQKELEKKQKYEAEEKVKQEAFEKLTPEEKRKAPIEILPEKEREKKEYEQTIPGALEYAKETVQSRGAQAVVQAAKGIVSEAATSVKEHFFPPTKAAEQKEIPLTEIIVDSPEIGDEDTDEDIFEELEETYIGEYIDDLKNIIPNTDFAKLDGNTHAAIQNKIKNIIDKLVITTPFDAYAADAKEFVETYNTEFTPQQKQTFVLFFFPPTHDEHFEKNKQIIMQHNKLSDSESIQKIRIIKNEDDDHAYFYGDKNNNIGVAVIGK